MSTNSQNAIIYVNKLEAARRQLNAAVRMYITGEDNLAIHTVAAAAHGILRHLLEKRGLDFFDDAFRVGLFHMAKEMASGALSVDTKKTIMGDEYLREIVEGISDRITQRGSDVQIDEIDSIIPRSSIITSCDAKRSRLANLTKASNFLKHADRDHLAAISSDEVDNHMLIIGASAAYTMLSHDMTGEMAVFYALASVIEPDRFQVTDYTLKALADVLLPLSASRRRQACLRMIKNWSKVF